MHHLSLLYKLVARAIVVMVPQCFGLYELVSHHKPLTHAVLQCFQYC